MRRWAIVVVPLWAVLALCCYWQPVVRDTWGHYHWHRTYPMSLDLLWQFAHDNYLHLNPRLGQVLTWLVTVWPWHPIVTPIVELGMFYALTALALGRWPGRTDALAFATVTALALACMPATASMLFYAPFTGNYLYGFALNVALLVPYRFAVARELRGGIGLAIGLVVLGAAAGLCNEHTGPAFGALIAAAIYVRRRALRPWMIAGLVGLAAGWLALMLAPGQDVRYNGLAQEAGTLQRIVDRGAGKDLYLLVRPFFYLGWAVPWIALAAWKRAKPSRVVVAGWLAAFLDRALRCSARRRPASGSTSRRRCSRRRRSPRGSSPPRRRRASSSPSPRSRSRSCAASASRPTPSSAPKAARASTRSRPRSPAKIVKVRPFSRPLSRWFLGEDFLEADHRKAVAHDFGATDIELTPAAP